MIRIAHFSDLHYGPKNLIEADRCFSAAVDRAIAMDAQTAVLSGDATDHALDLHAPSAERLAKQVRRLADHCPVLMLQGTFSHEPPGTLAIFRLLGGRHPVHVADRIGQVGLTKAGRWLVSAGWRFDELPAGLQALFTCVPTVNKAMVAAALGASASADGTGEHLAALLAGFAPVHRVARRQGVPSVGVSHGTVFGCLSEHGVPMAGFDHEFTTGTLFAAEAQAFMLGHIHRHQAWQYVGRAGRQCLAYAGSIGRFHYDEEGEKGFLMWEVDANGASLELVATPARRTVDIVFEGKPNLEALRAAIVRENVEGAHVRVRWTVADEDRHVVSHELIQRELASAAGIKLEARIVPLVRTRAAGISQASSLADKVRHWARVTEAKSEPLLALLAQLQVETADVIAERALRGELPVPLGSVGPSADLPQVLS